MKILSSEPKDYLVRSGKGLITSIGLKNIRRSKKTKKSRFVITDVIIKDLSYIIKEYTNFPYEVSVIKRSKHMPNDFYFYIVRHIAKCMMRNLRCTVRTQKTSTQNIPNLHVFYIDKRKSERINLDKSESEIVNVDVCSTDKSESKSVHEMDISVNTGKINYTKYE